MTTNDLTKLTKAQLIQLISLGEIVISELKEKNAVLEMEIADLKNNKPQDVDNNVLNFWKAIGWNLVLNERQKNWAVANAKNVKLEWRTNQLAMISWETGFYGTDPEKLRGVMKSWMKAAQAHGLEAQMQQKGLLVRFN